MSVPMAAKLMGGGLEKNTLSEGVELMMAFNRRVAQSTAELRRVAQRKSAEFSFVVI